MFVSLQANVQQAATGYTVTLHSASVAPFVWLDVGNVSGRFGSNGFLMVSRNMTVGFEAWRPTSVAELSRSLTVISLADVYWPETSQQRLYQSAEATESILGLSCIWTDFVSFKEIILCGKERYIFLLDLLRLFRQFSKCLLVFSCKTIRAEKHLKPVVRPSRSTEILHPTFQTKRISLCSSFVLFLTKGRPAEFSHNRPLHEALIHTNPSDKEMQCVKINTCLITFNEINWMKNYSRFLDRLHISEIFCHWHKRIIN